MYLNNGSIYKEKINTAITLLKIITNFTKAQHRQKSINSVSSLLIKEPTCQDSTEIQLCSANSRPMYQDIKIENCQVSKVKQPQEIEKPSKPKISKDKPSIVTKIPNVQVKEDDTLPNKSMEMPISPKEHTCGKAILVESPMFRRKSLWITPKPSSVYKEHYKSIPKIMNIKY